MIDAKWFCGFLKTKIPYFQQKFKQFFLTVYELGSILYEIRCTTCFVHHFYISYNWARDPVKTGKKSISLHRNVDQNETFLNHENTPDDSVFRHLHGLCISGKSICRSRDLFHKP